MSRKRDTYVTQPFLPPLEEFVPYLEEIWESKSLTNGGAFHQRLEQELCAYLDVPYISLFANGTVALITALQSTGLTGEVITTPYSFVATSHALLWTGNKPVFVDVSPDSLNIDPRKIEAAITPQTTAILAVHCYGYPCDVEAIKRIADRHGLKVIYDAAHAFGVSMHDGSSVLNYGELSVLSFHATKVFNTFEGGAVVCRDQKTKDHLDHLKNFGFSSELNVVAAGMNGKMSEFNAALGLLQLKHVDKVILKRKGLDAKYRAGLAGVKGIRCLGNPKVMGANYSYFPILVDREYPVSRDDLWVRMRENSVHARRYFYPLISDFTIYKSAYSSPGADLSVASCAAAQVLCLPLYPDLPPVMIEKICRIIREQ